ncbi:MAG TPA: FAD-dependent oxidoreductase [Candidatus Methylacidiphilales bacterium]|nr:FAD-dependent oxidoreductase [Candidatus Methylacidiphilales bacterium]
MKKKIVILGGGFGGVYTAVHLEKLMTFEERKAIEIAVVSHDNYMVFQPLLPEVISGSVELNHVISPIRRLAKSARLYTREVEAIDIATRTIKLSPGAKRAHSMITYDHLVIALGTRLDHSKIPGMREHATPFKYLADALYLRNQLVRALEEAEAESDPELRRSLLTFVVAGGGFSGVECIAEMNDFLRDAIRSYHHISEENLRLVLLQRGDRILPELTEDLSVFARDLLMKRGVEIQFGSALKSLSADSATVENSLSGQVSVIMTRTVVATVPAGPHPLVSSLPLTKEKGRIVVDEGMEVRGMPGVWALGDCAWVKQVDGMVSPPTAQHALRQARTCAHNIMASLRGTRKQAFTFTGLGKMGSLGRRSAVAQVFGFRLKGVMAWMLWRGVYATKFPGLDGQIRLLIDWFLDAFLPRDITQLRLYEENDVHREHFEAGEEVFHEGEVGDKVYFIVHGQAHVFEGDDVIATLGPGELFGEKALVCNQNRNATVRAATALDAVVVRRRAFQELLTNLPGLNATIEAVMSHRMGRSVDLCCEVPSTMSEERRM